MLNGNSSKIILEKYKNAKSEDDMAPLIVFDQKMNLFLIELAKLAEIDGPVRETYYIGKEIFDEAFPKHELLGTQAGKRTFISNAISLGIPANIVMKCTGHSDQASMKSYIDRVDGIEA